MSAEPEDMPEDVDPKEVGLTHKYMVYKRVPRPGMADQLVPVEDEVFVLKPSTDFSARVALRAYSTDVFFHGHEKLARDINAWMNRLATVDALSKREEQH